MDPREESKTDADAPTPPWVYVAGALLIAVALAFVAMHLGSGGAFTHR